MVEIAKCRMCGGNPRAKIVRKEAVRPHYLNCANLDCGVDGPVRPTEAEAIRAWNALMSPASPEPAAGTVRVRIPVYLHGQGRLSLAMQYRPSKGWEDVVVAKSFVSLQRVAYITADIPLPQPVEIPGTVESGE